MYSTTCRRCGGTTSSPVPVKACPYCRAAFPPAPSTSAAPPTLTGAPPVRSRPGTAGAPPLGGPSSPPPRRSSLMMPAAIGAAVLLLLAVCVPLLLVGLSRRDSAPTAESPTPAMAAGPTLVDQLVGRAPTVVRPVLDRADLTAKVDPSVVLIRAELDDGEGFGSGFLVDDRGTVATNRHVIEDSLRLVVIFNDESVASSAKVVYVDPEYDFALVRVASSSRLPPPLPLAEALPKKGEDVAAFGSPGGLLTFSTSFGNVSALREYDDWHVVQFTAPVSPGNSGGPVVNRRGEVVGITTFQLNLEHAQNLNFALSAVNIAETIERLKKTGRLK